MASCQQGGKIEVLFLGNLGDWTYLSQTTRGGGGERGQGVCDCRDRKKQRRTEGQSAKTYRTHFIKKSFFLLLNFSIFYFSFLFNIQCSHTLLECHVIVFTWTTNPCFRNRKTLTHAGRLSSSSVSSLKSSQTAPGIISCSFYFYWIYFFILKSKIIY